jgi:hypothetical protein
MYKYQGDAILVEFFAFNNFYASYNVFINAYRAEYKDS